MGSFVFQSGCGSLMSFVWVLIIANTLFNHKEPYCIEAVSGTNDYNSEKETVNQMGIC